MEKTQNQKFTFPKAKPYILISLLISFALVLGIASMLFFIPEFMFPQSQWFGIEYLHGKSYFWTIYEIFIKNGNQMQLITASILLGSAGLKIIIGLIFGWYSIRSVIMFYKYPKWYNHYLQEHTKIINSCNVKKFKDRVAMVVPTCNDFLPNSILQTGSQTYPNMDVWISDDSNKPEVMKAIDDFCKEHGFHVLHRDPAHKKAHPTKVGNLYYWIEKMGDKYDYVFENDSSSLVTSTFVENCLCYYNSPLYDHSKDGGIVCNGSFYGTQNLISYFNQKAQQFSESHICAGGAANMLGHPVMLNGWGAMYKISTLKLIPLQEVECPICDSARGIWLTKHGYHNYLNPFDFSGKFSPQNVETLKNQRLKWNGGDVFIFRNGLIGGKYPTKLTGAYVKFFAYQVDILIPAFFFISLIDTVCACILDFIYINFSLVILLTILIIVAVIFLLVLANILKTNLILMLTVAIYSIFEYSILYKRVYQIIVRGFIKRTWSSGAVTIKTVHQTTIKQRFRMSVRPGVILLVSIAICMFLQLGLPHIPGARAMNFLVIWFTLFPFMAAPSIAYLILVWLGEMHVQEGYDDRMKVYPIEKIDFRFKYVRESEVWKRQHPNDIYEW